MCEVSFIGDLNWQKLFSFNCQTMHGGVIKNVGDYEDTKEQEFLQENWYPFLLANLVCFASEPDTVYVALWVSGKANFYDC